jgi:TPR repeat protein
MAQPEFVPRSVDTDLFLEYQRKVVPPELHYVGARRVPEAVVTKSPLEQLIDAADGGDAFSQNAYGCRLRDGDGVPRDYANAARYFKMAADRGNVEGMINYGLCLENGQGVPEQDMAEAAKYYRRAMDAGDAWGMFCYADMLEFGKGVPKDPPRAAQLYKLAADSGHDRAQSKYGIVLEFGKCGVQKNLEEAVRYYKMASDQGSAEGMFNYADMLEYGKGVQKDTGEALRLYRLGATKQHSKSIAYLGVLMLRGTLLRRDVANGRKLINYVGEHGFAPLAAESYLRAGVTLVNGENGVAQDVDLGIDCIQRAARLGNKQAADIMRQIKSALQ